MTGNLTPRDYNKASVLHVLLSRAPMTRLELIELTGLSKATMSRLIEELRADGCVINGGVDEVTGRGRRSTYLDVPGAMGHVAGISLGVESTCVLVTDLRGREVQHVLVPTVDQQNVEKAGEWLAGLVAEASKSAEGPLRQIVAAVPGRVRGGTEIFGPAESMKIFAGSGLQRTLADVINAPVLLDSDANASLLGILHKDTTSRDAALLSMSSTLNVANCIDRELLRRRTPTFGDIGVLFAGVGNERLEGLLSTGGLLRFAQGRGLDLQRIEDLWLRPHDEMSRAEVLDAFTTAVVTAVSAAAVMLDPESVYCVGRLRPLLDEVLPEVRSRLDNILITVPEVKAPKQVIGLSVARGAVYACLEVARARIRETVLEARRQDQQTAPPAPAF